MYYVGECRVCGTGPLGIRACGNCDRVVILCDECDAFWTDADLNATPHYADEDDLPCPGCQSSLFDPPSHWASEAEINTTKWLQKAIQTKIFDLKQGTAFAPDVNEPDSEEE